MSQGFVNQSGITLPLAVAQGGTGVTTSTGTNKVVLSTAPTFDTSIAFADYTKGILGTTTNNNAGSGYVGEFVSSTVLQASSVSLSDNTATDLTSISLTAGDWDVWGRVVIINTTYGTTFAGWVSSTSASIPNLSLQTTEVVAASVMSGFTASIVPSRFSLSSTTTIYVTGYVRFTTGSSSMCGGIFARRVR